MPENSSKTFEQLTDLHQLARKEFEVLPALSESADQHFSTALYATMIGIVEALIILNENKNTILLQGSLRSLLEAYIDFENLIVDPSYLLNMRLKGAKDWVQLLTQAKAGNPYLAPLAASPNIDEKLEFKKDETSQLTDKGAKILGVEDRFKKAGRENEYRTIYKSLCGPSHNNINALITRHIKAQSKNSPFEILLESPTKPHDMDIVSTLSHHFLLASSIKIHDHLGSGKSAEFI